MTTKEQAARYRALVLEVDKTRGAYVIAAMEAVKDPTMGNELASSSSLSGLTQAQRDLERHVNEYGIPKLGQRY